MTRMPLGNRIAPPHEAPGFVSGQIAEQAKRAMLANATNLLQLVDLGVERGFTLYPEWGLARRWLASTGSRCAGCRGEGHCG